MPATVATKNRSHQLAAALTIGLVPAFVLSQWFAVRWTIPIRAAFNITVLVVAALLIVMNRSVLATYRRELGISAALMVSVVTSAMLHFDSVAVAVFGALPYFGAIVILLAALGSPMSQTDLTRAVGVIVATITIMAVAAVLQLAFGRPAYVASLQDLSYPRWWERGRATGLVANPGRLGQLGVFAIALTPLVSRRRMAFALVSAIVVAASSSRLAVLVSLAVLMAWPLLRSQKARRTLLVAGAGVIAAVLVIQLTVPEARDNLWSRTTSAISEATNPDGEARDIRVENLRSGWNAWRAAPVLGWGPGRFGSTTAWRYGSELHKRFDLPDVRSQEVADALLLQDGSEIDIGTAQLDLGWLQIATELGVVGLIGFLALLASVMARAWKNRSVTSLSLIGALGLFTVASPGLVDLSLAVVFLWWAGVTVATEAT